MPKVCLQVLVIFLWTPFITCLLHLSLSDSDGGLGPKLPFPNRKGQPRQRRVKHISVLQLNKPYEHRDLHLSGIDGVGSRCSQYRGSFAFDR